MPKIAEPRLTAYLQEKEDSTSTNRVGIAYGDEDPDAGVFDNYVFTIDTNPPNTVTKSPTDVRSVTFDKNLEAGTHYTVTVYTVSGRKQSDSETITVTTST